MRIFGVLRMAPWWRGPLLLLRRGGVVVALMAAGAIAALPAAAATPKRHLPAIVSLHSPCYARETIAEICSLEVALSTASDRALPRGYLLIPLSFPSALAVRVPTLALRLSASCLCSSSVGSVFFAKAARSESLDCAAPWNSATAFE